MTAPARRVAEPGGHPPAIQFRGGLYTLMLLRVGNPRDQDFFSAIMEKIAQAPDFFRNAPVVLDLQDLADSPPFNMAELVRRLRQHQLVPIGVTNGTEAQNKSAVNAGLSLMPEGREPPVRHSATSSPAAPAGEPVETASPPTGAALVINHPVRSGQQVYADEGDMVVLSSISPGAELLAKGHIHVYGTLRGRAFAGVAGDESARIFCRSLEAELVSIAGLWRVREDFPEDLIGRQVQMFLDSGRLCIEPLT